MGLGDFLGKVAGDIGNTIKDANEERKERMRIRDEQAEKDRIMREKILRLKSELLDKFDFPQLKQLCRDMLGREPKSEFVDEKTGAKYRIEQDRHYYVEFIIKESGLRYSHIKDYALKNKIVTPSFFGEESSTSSPKQNDFEIIVNSIKAQFEPEKITDEEHLQAQVTIFLKAKFPEKKIEREVSTKRGDKLDIVVDGNFVFELKVPQDRTALRNLSAQLEEYKEEYPNICAVIYDDESKNLTTDINEYVDKYKKNYSIQSIILRGKKRG
jgi:hypothetical protein